jgi:hypothetical protein
LRTTVFDRLAQGGPPEQIAGRRKHDDAPVRVSHESIYRFIPRGTDPNSFSNNDLQDLAGLLNNIPRKCLGFKTSVELFNPTQTVPHFKCESTSPPAPGMTLFTWSALIKDINTLPPTPERCEFAEIVDLARNGLALADEKVGDGGAKAGIGDIMR